MLTLGEVNKALGKANESPQEDLVFESIITDSRKADKSSLFVAIKGEALDGHEFISSALEKGAPFAVAEFLPPNCPSERVLIVPNSKSALLKIAGAYRRKFSLPLVGVTGSVGKTTTREFIYTVLSAEYKTLENEENLNNEIGVSHRLLQLNENHEAAVMEMGMDGLGQIEEISAAAFPQIAVITNIGVSHLEKLKTR
ncbi:MAG: Mur ligase family protein, partial [Oscillospiraceae bacterium]